MEQANSGSALRPKMTSYACRRFSDCLMQRLQKDHQWSWHEPLYKDEGSSRKRAKIMQHVIHAGAVFASYSLKAARRVESHQCGGKHAVVVMDESGSAGHQEPGAFTSARTRSSANLERACVAAPADDAAGLFFLSLPLPPPPLLSS